jgi:shikimate kinase
MNNIIFIGFMATGKSTIGRKIAKILGLDFLDTDQEIEALLELPISRIFKKHGEIRFRSEERLMVNKLTKRENCVISTGGGTVLDPVNVEKLKHQNLVICLKADPEIIYKRIRRKNNRPIVSKRKSLEDIIELIESRNTYYQIADLYIDTSNVEEGQVIEMILNFIKERGKHG